MAAGHGLRATVSRGQSLDADIVEVVGAPRWRRAFKPGQSTAAEYETWRCVRRHRARGEGSPSLARRSIASGAPSTCARDGGSSNCVRISSRRAGGAHGPTGGDRDAARRDVLLIGGGSATLCCSDRAGAASDGSRVIYFAGYKRGIDRYKGRGDRARRRRSSSGAATRHGLPRPASAGSGFVGNIVAAIDAYGPVRSVLRTLARRVDRVGRDRLDA